MTAPDSRPNVLLVTTDHWPGRLFGALGSAIQTPTLDQLARNGVRYPNAYSECPVCIPARRTLMTGTTTRTHGDRTFSERLPMPDAPTLAATFRDAGYQANAVGKLHVHPPRNRIGFDDVVLMEEGRTQFGAIDDYEIALTEAGYGGDQFMNGMNNNEYIYRPWHLPEELHPTNWATRQMARTIQRRDPTRPAFWYLSYLHPHPPLQPLAWYLDFYRDIEPDARLAGTWANDPELTPPLIQRRQLRHAALAGPAVVGALRAFYAQCTQIDHQLRIVLGTLREEGLLDNTIVLFTADHGDMLGSHGVWAKRLYYDQSANIPMILMGLPGDERTGVGVTDDRLVGLQDVMPTLLGLAGISAPVTVEGRSMVSDSQRDWLYGEINEGPTATRMVHDGRFKLIYYPEGNQRQLFDLATDPDELVDLAVHPDYTETVTRLTDILKGQLYGADLEWLDGDRLTGLPRGPIEPVPNRTFSTQRGLHWPPPPKDDRIVSIG